MLTAKRRVRSRRRQYLPWFCAIVGPLLLVAMDYLLRARELDWGMTYQTETRRREVAREEFQLAVAYAHADDTPDGITKRLSAIGKVTESEWRSVKTFHVENPANGDVGDIRYSKKRVEGTIEFQPDLPEITSLWWLFSPVVRILSWMIFPLLLLGFAVFYMPFRQRPWALMLALFGAIGSQLSPSPSMWFVFSRLSTVPLLTLTVTLLAALIKPRVTRTDMCAKCKYNLTGNTSGVCPECGTPIPPPPPRLPDLEALASNLNLVE